MKAKTSYKTSNNQVLGIQLGKYIKIILWDRLYSNIFVDILTTFIYFYIKHLEKLNKQQQKITNGQKIWYLLVNISTISCAPTIQASNNPVRLNKY